MLLNGKAFSLLELLSVVTLVLIVAALSVPAAQRLTYASARCGTVDLLHFTFEQARMEAIASATPVYIGFTCEQGPSTPGNALIIFQETDPHDSIHKLFVPLDKWHHLPRPFVFKHNNFSLTGASNDSAPFPVLIPGGCLPDTSLPTQLPALMFGPTGSVLQPTEAGTLQLLIGTDTTRVTGALIVSRYSGRVHWTDSTPENP